MMDTQLGLVVAGIVLVCALVVLAVSIFGMKEKTYEEAIAEQRKLPDEHLLLGRSAKDKARDKKQKKAGKKVKEKSEREKNDGGDNAKVHHDKGHVDFEEPEAEVISERHPTRDELTPKAAESAAPTPAPQEAPKANKGKSATSNSTAAAKTAASKVEKAPAATSNKQEKSVAPAKEPAVVPKEKEQKVAKQANSNSAPAQGKQANNTAPAPVKQGNNTASAPTKQANNTAPAPAKQANNTAPAPAKQANNTAAAPAKQATNNGPAPVKQQDPATPPPAKERSRKKRSELATLQQMSGDHDGVNVSLLMPLVQKAVLSRSEIQILIDLLLNKQQGPTVGSSEWIEGRQDPMVKLKKQLSEKEKALAEEQDAHQALQSKLKELRTELNSERSRLSHANRQLEETLASKQSEVQALGARLQHVHDATNVEKQALSQQVQQLQQKLNDEHGRLRASQEEQSALSQELLSQRQQLEMHIGHLNEQEVALKAQVAQLEGVNATLNAELQGLQSQMIHYKEGAEHAQDMAQQIEELNLVRTELEHRVNANQQHEASLQFEISGLRSKLEELQGELSAVQDLRADNEKLASQVAAYKELQMEVQHLRDENSHLSSQSLLLSEIQREAQQLREENESLAAQVTSVTERPAAEGRENGDLHYPEEKQTSFAQAEQRDSLMNQKDVLIGQLEEDLKKKEALVEKLTSELNTYKTDISRVSKELEEQRNRNNEACQKVRQDEQTEVKQLLQRIFPEIRVEDIKAHQKWVEQFETHARGLLSELKCRPREARETREPQEESSAALLEQEKQNTQQAMVLVSHYKTIIDETEGMLNKLQTHVEQEEARWRQQLQLKEAELEAAREQQESSSSHQPPPEMQLKLEELQEKVERLEVEKSELVHKYESARAACDQLEQVKSDLALQLEHEADKRQDLSQEVTKLRSLVQIGKDALSQEQALVSQLQQQVNGVSQNHNVASNGPAPEPSITEGGSGKK